MIVEHVQILDHDHLFTRHQLTQGIDQNLAFFVVCIMEKTKNRDCVIYPITQYNFLLHIYNLPFEWCFLCCSQIKTICNFGVVTLEAVLNSNGGLFVDARPMMPAKEWESTRSGHHGFVNGRSLRCPFGNVRRIRGIVWLAPIMMSSTNIRRRGTRPSFHLDGKFSNLLSHGMWCGCLHFGFWQRVEISLCASDN